MHLEEHTVEEEVVGRGPVGRVSGQAGEDELLGVGKKREKFMVSLLWPHSVRRGSLQVPRPQESNSHGAFVQECAQGEVSC